MIQPKVANIEILVKGNTSEESVILWVMIMFTNYVWRSPPGE